MWGKIRDESVYDGPAVWELGEESREIRWREIIPKSPNYGPIDFSATPVGHLLNLFSDVVSQHDLGWFTRNFVEALHDEIRKELESRIPPSRERRFPCSKPSMEQREIVVDAPLKFEAGETKTLDLEKTVDLGQVNFVLVAMSDDQGRRYPVIIPGHKIRTTTTDDFDPHRSFAFSFGPTGFNRWGVGIRLREL